MIAVGESFVGGQLPQIDQRQPVDAQRVLESRVQRGRIDERNESQLANLRQTAKLGRIDDLPHTVGHRHIDFRRNAHHTLPSIQGGHFRNIAEHGHDVIRSFNAQPKAPARIG